MNRRGTRRLPPNGATRLFFAVLLAALGTVIIGYAVATRDEAVDQTAAIVATTFAGVFALMFLIPAYVLYRKVFPPRLRGVKIDLSEREVRRGDDIEATLRIRSPRKAGDLRVGLVCRAFYDVRRSGVTEAGGAVAVTLERVEWQKWERTGTDDRVRAMRFAVPGGAPFSYRGKVLSFGWSLSVEKSRRLGFDRVTNIAVTVRP